MTDQTKGREGRDKPLEPRKVVFFGTSAKDPCYDDDRDGGRRWFPIEVAKP